MFYQRNLIRRPLSVTWTHNLRLAYSHNVIVMANETQGTQPSLSKLSDKNNNVNKKESLKLTTTTLEEIRSVRIEKINKLKEIGQLPFAYKFTRTHLANDLQETYKDLKNGEEAEMEDKVYVSGRIMASRIMGKLSFLKLIDESGTIQLYIDKKIIENEQKEGYSIFKKTVDIGDIIGAGGRIKRTEKGELSIVVTSMTMLTKSIRLFPDKWHGLTDIEKRYRQRYLDMIVNPEVKNIFKIRAKITSNIRHYLENRGYLEVETPILENMAGGADADPFITYHNTLEKKLTLRIASELHLKRLIVGGFEKIFEIGRIFRNEGISTRHNPEFTSIELYEAYADYYDMMDLTQDLIQSCVKMVNEELKLNYGDNLIDFSRPFRRISMIDIVKECCNIDFNPYIITEKNDISSSISKPKLTLNSLKQRCKCIVNESDLTNIIKSESIDKLNACDNYGMLLNELFEIFVEPNLIQPTFIIDYPIEISPLAKIHRNTKYGLVERFELFIAGRELANSFSELTDPIDQKERFQNQIKNKEGINLDEDFIMALEYGMPPTGGMGLGLDRLIMILTNSQSIRDVIAFPLLK